MFLSRGSWRRCLARRSRKSNAFCLCAVLVSSVLAVGQRPTGGGIPTGGRWAQLSDITSESVADTFFGRPILAVNGSTLVTVPYVYSGNAESAAYIYVKSATGWSNMQLVATLSFGAGLTGSAYSVAANSNTIAVSTATCPCPPGQSAVYVYVKPTGGWTDMTPTAVLTGSDVTANDSFGSSVALSGDTIVAGADYSNSGVGAAYLFVQPAGGWTNMTQTAKLTASDAASGDLFGYAVAADGDTVVIGAPQNPGSGKAYVFVQPAGGWKDTTQNAELTGSDLKYEHTSLGQAVDVKGNIIVAGAGGQINATNAPGAAYVYVRPGGGWANMTQTTELVADQFYEYAGFGRSVGIGDGLIAVGAPDGRAGHNLGGTVSIFEKPAGGWEYKSSSITLNGAETKFRYGFGDSISIDGREIAVAAPFYPDYVGNNHIFLFAVFPPEVSPAKK